MAKAKSSKKEKALVIVESPAKARTISRFLGDGFTVEASIGHIRDLPEGRKEMPENLKNEEWARLGVNVDDRFQPVYIVPDAKKKHVNKLKKLLKDSSELYLATDEDREGEAISWHLNEILNPKVPVHRLVFHEITRDAITEALENPRGIDDGLVKAQETRRILDRLYGFEMSAFLWKKSLGRSAGRDSFSKEMPENLKNEEWARLGVNVDDRFQPVYIVPDAKKKHVNKLKKLLKDSSELYLATDEDREGEAISWHLNEILNPKVPVHRLVFHEITRDAITEALENPRGIDDGLVKAQETRRILDRLYGFEMSAFLWKKSLGRSAGRVQSVAVRLIVERERERMAFHSATYWDLSGLFKTEAGEKFEQAWQKPNPQKKRKRW